MTPDWTPGMQRQALEEGWGVFDSDGHIEIQRHDEAEVFTGDDAAEKWVWIAAEHGHALAQQAISYLTGEALKKGTSYVKPASRTGWKATVEIIILANGVNSEADACDWVSNLLSENSEVKDWGYIQYADARRTEPVPVEIPSDYQEGDLISSNEGHRS